MQSGAIIGCHGFPNAKLKFMVCQKEIHGCATIKISHTDLKSGASPNEKLVWCQCITLFSFSFSCCASAPNSTFYGSKPNDFFFLLKKKWVTVKIKKKKLKLLVFDTTREKKMFKNVLV